MGGDYYQICAKHSGKSLDIDLGPGATTNGAGAQQWDYWGGDNQKFKLTALRPACANDQIDSTFGGRAELTANRVSTDAFVESIELLLAFTQCRANVGITNFPQITTREYPTIIGPNVTKVSLTGGGSGRFAPDRSISVPITLHFQHRLEMDPRTALLARASDLTVTLSGTVAPDGEVTLVGSGTFIGGYLNGSTGNLKITGRLSPSP